VLPRISAIVVASLLLVPQAFGAGRGSSHEVQVAVDGILEGREPHSHISRIIFLRQESYASNLLATRLHAHSVDMRRRAAEGLARLAGPAQLGALTHAAEDGDGPVRMATAQALGRAGRGAVPVLLGLLGDKTYGVRREAARALGKVGGPAEGPKLFARLKDEPELEVQTALILATGEVKAKAMRPKLVPLLRSDSEGTRQAATRALCLLGASEGFAQVNQQLQGKELYPRLAAVELLAGVPLKHTAPLLKPLLDDPEPRIQAVAARSLAQAGEAKARTWLILAAAQAAPGKRDPYLRELETLGVTEVESNRVLRKAGLK